MLKTYLLMFCLFRLLHKFVQLVIQVLVYFIESFFKHSIEVRHHGFARAEFILRMGNGVIVFGDSITLFWWHLRDNTLVCSYILAQRKG